MQPDIHCKKCGGLGVAFSFQKKAVVSQTVMIRDNSGMIELDAGFTDCPLTKCYDNSGGIYENATKTGSFVMFNTPTLPVKGLYVTAVMEEDILHTVEKITAGSAGSGYYRVSGLCSSRMKTEGLYHTAPGDIESIEEVKDIDGNVYEVGEIRQDCIFVKPREVEEDGEIIEVEPPKTLYVKNVKYIPPFTFVILNQNLSKSNAQVMQENNGDAVLTFPYAYDVTMDDVITVLSGIYTQKNVVTKKDADYDVSPAYFVKVVKAIPQIRTSENQRMPNKAIIKLYATYGEKRGVNKN